MSKCEIVRDLIPLYVENIAGNESKKLVENHCAECAECNRALNLTRKTIKTKSDNKEKMDVVWKNLKRQRVIRIVRNAVIIVLISILLFAGLRFLDENINYAFNPVYSQGSPVAVAYGGEEIYSERNEGCSERDRKELEPLMKKIKQALEYDGSVKSAKKKFGKILSKLSYGEKDITITELNLNLISAKLYHDMGYMWIAYERYGYENRENGEDISDNEEAVRLTLIKEPYGGDWKAVQYRCAP